jgi:hypothetical protein
MLRLVFGSIGAAALILGFVSAGASAQHRPAAWDTRVRSDTASAATAAVIAPSEQPLAQPDGQKKAKKKNARGLNAPK